MSKKEIKKKLSRNEFISYLQELIEDLKNGYIKFNEEKHSIPDNFEFELEIEEKKKENKIEKEIKWEIEWKTCESTDTACSTSSCQTEDIPHTVKKCSD